MNIEIQKIVRLLAHLRCERKAISNGFTLSLGFGDIDSSESEESPYRKWEIGSYYRNWRIRKENNVICGSLMPCDSLEEMEQHLNDADLQCVLDITQNESGDVTLEFDNEWAVDFLCMAQEDDGMFHIFYPDKNYIEYNPISGWKSGGSNVPWG